MNLNKSCLQFGAKVRNSTKETVRSALGIKDAADAGNYLGIPTNWGRSKKATLNYIKDWFMKKLHGWRLVFLNKAGKEVLIKAIITVIPKYLMPLFKLPKTWCEEIAKMIERFWWNGRNDRRSMH